MVCCFGYTDIIAAYKKRGIGYDTNSHYKDRIFYYFCSVHSHNCYDYKCTEVRSYICKMRTFYVFENVAKM